MESSRSTRIHQIGEIIFVLIIAVTYTWATWSLFTRRVPGGNDFMAHYSAWKAFFYYGFDPYSDQAAQFTQQLIYGRAALPDEDQNRLTYPFYSLIFHAPLIIFEYSLARAIYMVLLQAALIIGIWINLDLINWHPDKWVLGLLLAWSVTFYPQARGIILGQFAIFGYLSLVGCLYFLKQKKDFLAGVILVISTVKPTLVFLVVPLLLLYGIFWRRIAFLIGFITTLSVLMIGSFLILPSWMHEWFLRMRQYSDYTMGQSPVWLISNSLPAQYQKSGEILLVSILLAGMLCAWWQVFRAGGERYFYWTLGITLIISSLIVPRSATTNYVMLLAITLWIFAALNRSGSWGRFVMVMGVGATLVGYWWLHFASVVGNQEQAVMFLPYPIAIGLVLFAGRRWLIKDAESFTSMA